MKKASKEAVNEFLKQYYNVDVDGADDGVLMDAVNALDDFYIMTENESYNEIMIHIYDVLDERKIRGINSF